MFLDDDLANEIETKSKEEPIVETKKVESLVGGSIVQQGASQQKPTSIQRIKSIEFLDKYSKNMLLLTSKSFKIVVIMYVIAFSVGIVLIGTSVYLMIDNQINEKPSESGQAETSTLQTLLIQDSNQPDSGNTKNSDSSDNQDSDNQNIISAILASLGVSDIVILLYKPGKEIQKSRIIATKIDSVYSTWINTQSKLDKTYTNVEKHLVSSDISQVSSIVTELLKIHNARISSTTDLLNSINITDEESSDTSQKTNQTQPTTNSQPSQPEKPKTA